MTPQLQQVLDAARTLSLNDKLELLEVISRDVRQWYAFNAASEAFWSPRSIDEIAQTAPVITDIRALAVDFWPEDETADDFNQFVTQQRRADRMRKA
ncbi:MAG: hypothetical protein NZ701_03655 [Roseiflexus sp.]|nr:hypothetical protein [Roseiflexus sp.]